MNGLPDEIYRHIYSFLKPRPPKYKYSVIWCKYCGEHLKNGDWYIHMGHSQTNTHISYTCPICDTHNIHFETHDWMTLLDYINEYEKTDYTNKLM